uniref:Uncharacterized protein n=1 Tax=Anguilla anguilla TaxID=7936 RepID=A0A0E9QSX0_ANGAN
MPFCRHIAPKKTVVIATQRRHNCNCC